MMRSQRGFTLVEMLVSLSVAALLISLVYGAVRIGQRSATAIDQRVDESEVMRIGWQFLHDAVTRARPVPDPEDEENQTSFDGSANALTFVADMPAYVGLGGLMRIDLDIEDNRAGRQLVLTRRRFDAVEPLAPPTEESIERAVLVEDLDEVRIEYFGQTGEIDEPAWLEQWHGFSTLPHLVRLSVKPSGALAWPEMIAGPATGSTAFGEQPFDAEDEDLMLQEGGTEDDHSLGHGHGSQAAE